MKFKKTVLASSLALVFSVNLFGQEVYTIENKTLKEALEIISKKSSLSYIANDKLLESQQKYTIKNVEGVKKALDKLLHGSELKAIIKDDAIVIINKESVSQSKSKLGDVDVIADKNDKYFQLNRESSTGSRLGLTLKETPSSIEVLTSEIMDQRGDTTVIQAVTKSAGITGGQSGHGPGGQFIARGFPGVFPGIDFLNDGVKLNGSAFSKRAFETANLDRIEVIKGASSVLNGEGSTSATVNLITKKPSFTENETEFGLKIGSYDSYRLNFGTGGVAIEETLAYRVDVSTREKGSDYDGEKRTVDSLSAGLLYKINDDLFTSLSFDKTSDEGDKGYMGTPLVNGKLDASVRDINYNTYTDSVDKGENLFIKQNTQWYATSNLEFKNQVYYQNMEVEIRRPYEATQDGNSHDVYIAGADIKQKQDLIGNRIDLIHKENILGLQNKLLVGADISKMNFTRDMSSSWGGITTDMYNPIEGTFGDLNGTYRTKEIEVDITQISVYLEDQLNITDSIKFVAGLRHDTIDANWNYLQAFDKKGKTYNELSYRMGIVYDLSDTTTLYTSYTKSIESGSSLVEINSAQVDLGLTEAKQYEIGLKQSFLDDKAEFSISAYEINKENIFVTDPSNVGKVLNAGEQSSKGIELSLGVQPIEQFRIDTNLAYVDAEYDDFITGSDDYTGNTPYSVPKYVANFGVRYMPVANLGIGTWISHVDSFFVDDANTVELPSYTTIDLTLDYTHNANTTFSFAVKNATDELYATTSKSDNSVFLGDARNYEFGIKYKF